MRASHPLFQVDAFTDRPFTGNPAAVCLLQAAVDERWMQQVAQEMNLAETAFLMPIEDGYELRWFTPTTEVNLCGHATLASAHILWQETFLPEDQVARFHTKSGLLTAQKEDNWIVLDFPTSSLKPMSSFTALEEALPVDFVSLCDAGEYILIEVASAAQVKALTPDFLKLREVVKGGVIVTSQSDEEGIDFVSRFFAPAMGIDEDPVTGSAHCALGPFWQERLGQDAFVAKQVSPRSGILRLQVGPERTLLKGRAVTVLRGTLDTLVPEPSGDFQ